MKKKKSFSKKQIFILCSTVILLFLCFGTSLGRFIYDEIKNVYFNSKNFYFESDKLATKMARYQIDNWNGVDPHSITINMNSLKNNLVKSETDITYTISYRCSDNIICNSSKDNSIIYSATNTDYFTITLTPNQILNDGDSVWMEVTATSQEPYTKTISGRFVLTVGYYGLSYEITDNEKDVYLDLKITNTLDYYKVIKSFDAYQVGDKIDITTYLNLSEINKKNCASAVIELEFDPSTVLLDMTSSVYLNSLTSEVTTINGFDYINKISFSIDAISSQIIKFYKIDSTKNYTYPLNGNPSVITVIFS